MGVTTPSLLDSWESEASLCRLLSGILRVEPPNRSADNKFIPDISIEGEITSRGDVLLDRLESNGAVGLNRIGGNLERERREISTTKWWGSFGAGILRKDGSKRLSLSALRISSLRAQIYLRNASLSGDA